MSFQVLNNNIMGKCRLCLNSEQEMNSFFEPIYEAQDERESILISLAEVLKSISKIEVENNYELKNICGSCTTTILDFNNLMKVIQDTEEELSTLLGSKEEKTEELVVTFHNISDDKFVLNDNNIDADATVETYALKSQVNEDSCDSFDQTKTFDNSTLDNIINYSQEKCVSECQEDNAQLSNVLTKTLHLKDEGNIENEAEILSKKYSCNECGDVFLMKLGFTHHMLQKHNICISEKSFEQYSTDIIITLPLDYSDKAFKYVKKIPVQKQYRFQCQICKEDFASKEALKSHYVIHKTIKCNQCNAAFIKNSYLKDHMLMHSNEKKYICDVCGKAFKYRNGLAVHKTIHSNYKANICEACGQVFNAKPTLLTHIKLKHSQDEKKFPCSECDLVFKVKSWLDKHFKRKHTKNRTKDFKCSLCGVSYLNKTTLTRHMNDKHLGNGKRYSCPICEKSYTMKNKLVSHMQIKHSTI